jgi:16S rRNA (adenine1518-N6/adenine1519-N6)-dimethyltransferase
MLYKPSIVVDLLNKIDKKPKKSLSQNFLVDGNIVNKIVAFCAPQEGETILEIGPGLGVLTQALLKHNVKVIAIEKDVVLAKELEKLSSNLIVCADDFFKVDLDKVLPKNKIKVVSNLPYSVATAIISSLLSTWHGEERFSHMIFMVQKEVAKRMCASPHNKEYGFFTLFMNFFADVKYLSDVSKNCFYPKPKVTSALIKITPKIPPFKEGQEEFFSFLKQLFSHRRKMVSSVLKSIYGQEKIQDVFAELDIDLKMRPENLTLREFIELFDALT